MTGTVSDRLCDMADALVARHGTRAFYSEDKGTVGCLMRKGSIGRHWLTLRTAGDGLAYAASLAVLFADEPPEVRDVDVFRELYGGGDYDSDDEAGQEAILDFLTDESLLPVTPDGVLVLWLQERLCRLRVAEGMG